MSASLQVAFSCNQTPSGDTSPRMEGQVRLKALFELPLCQKLWCLLILKRLSQMILKATSLLICQERVTLRRTTPVSKA